MANWLSRLKAKLDAMTTRYDVSDAWYPSEQEIRKYLPDEAWK